jgi:hypothetical protein
MVLIRILARLISIHNDQVLLLSFRKMRNLCLLKYKKSGLVCQGKLDHRQMMLIVSNQQLFLTLPVSVVQEERNDILIKLDVHFKVMI